MKASNTIPMNATPIECIRWISFQSRLFYEMQMVSIIGQGIMKFDMG